MRMLKDSALKLEPENSSIVYEEQQFRLDVVPWWEENILESSNQL